MKEKFEPIIINGKTYPNVLKIHRGMRYTDFSFDLIRTPFDLTEKAQKEIFELFADYIGQHQDIPRIRRQYWSHGSLGSYLEILKTDEEIIKKKVLSIIQNLRNLNRKF